MKTQQELIKEVKPYYEKYISTVSVDYMAASIECCTFLMELCLKYDFKSILDLGSGFSSFCFRYLKKQYVSDLKCMSIDLSKDWIEKSKVFCTENKIKPTYFKLWKDLKPQEFDLIFIDIGMTKQRVDYYDKILEKFVSNKTFVLFDDMHKKILLDAVNKTLSQYTFKEIDIKDQTIDNFNRFSRLIYNTEKK